MKKRGKQIQYASYFPPDMIAKLQALSAKTGIPVAAYIRNGVALMLKERKITWRIY